MPGAVFSTSLHAAFEWLGWASMWHRHTQGASLTVMSEVSPPDTCFSCRAELEGTMQSPRVDEQQQHTAAHPSAAWQEQGSEFIEAHSPERMVQVGHRYCHSTAIPRALPADCTPVQPADQSSIICSADPLLSSDCLQGSSKMRRAAAV